MEMRSPRTLEPIKIEFLPNHSGLPSIHQPNVLWEDPPGGGYQYFNPTTVSQNEIWDIHGYQRVDQQRPHSVESYSSMNHSSPEPWHPIPHPVHHFTEDSSENITTSRKRKYQRRSTGVPKHIKMDPVTDEEAKDQRQQANLRERQRTSSLNTAFQTLRGVVPHLPSDKMSKIHTLQITVSYINFLTAVQQGLYSVDQPEVGDYVDSTDKLSCAFQMWRMEEESKRKQFEESLDTEKLSNCS